MQTSIYTNTGGIVPAGPTHVFIDRLDDAEPTNVLRIPNQSRRTPTSHA
jgi:hypothetical protein